MSRSTCQRLLKSCATICLCTGAALAWAEDVPTAGPAPLRVAATINSEPLYLGEVEAELPAIIKRRRIKPGELDFAKAGLLRQLVNRRLVEQTLVRDGYASEAEIVKELDKLRSRLKENGGTLEQATASKGVGLDAVRHEVAWGLAWNHYLERHLADALEGYFKEHHEDLDGTQVRASHILLREERPNEPHDQITARAEKIRQQIETGKITFEEAAEKYSAGPSRRQGGDLGFFPRDGVMAEDFSKAAFALRKGDISQPVVTAYGTHLIRVTDIKPGQTQWTEVIPKIKDAAAADLFEKLAAKELKTAAIEFTGNAPYFKPGTDDLVLPAKPAPKNASGKGTEKSGGQ